MELIDLKKLVMGITIGLAAGIAVTGFAAEAAQYIADKATFSILVNGRSFEPENSPVVIGGRTYLPLRETGEALGVRVGWNESLRRVEIGDSAVLPSNGSYGFSNPAPLNTIQTIMYKDYIEQYTVEMSIKELIRGDEAWNAIYKANHFNQKAPDGYEYILAKIYFKLSDIPDGKVFYLKNSTFSLISGDGKEYDSAFAVTPEPTIGSSLYKGSSNEGWAVFQVKIDDPNPKIAFGRNYDGTGGIWFKAH